MNPDPRPVIEPDISTSVDLFNFGPYRVWTEANGLPFAYFKRGSADGPSTVRLDDDQMVAVVEVHNAVGCELRARRFADPADPRKGLIEHELDGTSYPDRFTANQAAFEAGLTGVMIYDNQRSLIRVFHAREFHSKASGPHPMVMEVARYLMPPAHDPQQACQGMWIMTNNGNAPYRYPQVCKDADGDPRTVAYRARGNRPLRPGDIVSVDGTYYRCSVRGWDPMRTEPSVNQEPDDALSSTPLDPDTAPPLPA